MATRHTIIMIRSMTGYGRAERSKDDFSLVWEIKSVNSRFLDLKWRMPPSLRALETDLERIVRRHASRGRVEAGLNLAVHRTELLGLHLNMDLASTMLDQISALARKRSVSFEPDLNRLLNVSSLWQEASAEPDRDLARAVEETLEAALSNWNLSREREGAAMHEDLTARCANLRRLMQGVAERIPRVVREKTENLTQRIRTAMEQAGAELDTDRMLQESAILADRLDVSEETTRLAAHMDRLEAILSEEGESGKRLDFLLQEIFREINTCGNKCQDSEVSRLVVEFKAELEKCREQVQNIE